MSEKRVHESTTLAYSQSEQESVLKRFKGKYEIVVKTTV